MRDGAACADRYIRRVVFIGHFLGLAFLRADRGRVDSIAHKRTWPSSSVPCMGVPVDSVGLCWCGFSHDRESVVGSTRTLLGWACHNPARDTVFQFLAAKSRSLENRI